MFVLLDVWSGALSIWVHTEVSLFFSGCMDDIVTVLAEEHGCLDTIKVELEALVTSRTSERMYVIGVIYLGKLNSFAWLSFLHRL